jgi:hypothetical protein
MSTEASLDELMEGLAQYGRVTLYQRSELTWYCSIEMYTNSPAVKVELKAGTTHKQPRHAVIDVLAQAVKTINTFEFTRSTK